MGYLCQQLLGNNTICKKRITLWLRGNRDNPSFSAFRNTTHLSRFYNYSVPLVLRATQFLTFFLSCIDSKSPLHCNRKKVVINRSNRKQVSGYESYVHLIIQGRQSFSFKALWGRTSCGSHGFWDFMHTSLYQELGC